MADRLEDHRQFARVKLQAPLRYQIRGTPEFSNTVINNISLGGLSFNNNKFIPPNTLLTFQVDVLSRILNPIGRIAWASSLSRSDRYQFGVEFVQLDEAEKKYLNEYINMRTA